MAYWEGVLEGLPQELELPVDRPRPVRPSYRGGVVRAGVGAGVHRALVGVARGAGASVLMVAQAALAVAWSRSGAGVDVPVGTVVAGRGDEVLDEVVGFFVNTLVLRTDVSGDPSFGELLERVREADLGAFAHQEVPFEYLVRELNPDRVVGRHPLVQTMLSMDGESSATLSLPGLRCTPVEGAGERVAKFDLDVTVRELPGQGGVRISLVYAADLFDEATAQGLVDRMSRVLEAAALDPGAPISTIDVLAKRERADLERWGTGPRSTPEESTVAGAFLARAGRCPEAVAVVDAASGVELTYRELEHRARAFAGRVRNAFGEVTDVAVPVLAERSVDLVVAFTGILLAGGAYRPVHLGHPLNRQRDSLTDGDGTPLLVVDAAHRNHPLTEGRSVLTITGNDTVTTGTSALVGATNGEDAAAAGADLPCVLPDQLAYVMSTSGSTGRPKAIAITHRSVVDLAVDPAWEITA
ncbi:condensation domain-containing protein, partial [Streptomyces sp. GZWMJZ-114]|uniref:condensation domain-containing protein n=1 Tax=Streptomyces sp. GZWMJZ-114 TaxID=2494734 RepID=UPI00240D9C9F